MAKGGGYCCQCTIEFLFCALLSVSLIAIIFLVCLIYFNQDFHHPDTFKSLCISVIWNLSGVIVSILGLYGIWMNKSALLTLGCYYFYLNGIQIGFYSVTVILIKNPAWKMIVSYNEPLFINMLLKTMLSDKRLIMTITYLISTVASFYFALIVRSYQENKFKKSNSLVPYEDIFEKDKFRSSKNIRCHIHEKVYCNLKVWEKNSKEKGHGYDVINSNRKRKTS